MQYNNILVDFDESAAIVTLNRPDKLNALNYQTLAELKEVFKELGENRKVRAIILTGAGKKAFAAGADIMELDKLDAITGKGFSEEGQAIFDLIENTDKPVIAAINGYALGGGLELALACHFRIASENAKFGQPEVSLGLMPGYGGTQRLARIVNSGRAMEMILTAGMIDSTEALRIGLVNHVYPLTELIPKALEITKVIASKGPVSIKNAIRAINMANKLPLREGLNYEAALFALCCGSEDAKEGTLAFLEKRKPIFKL